MSLGSAAAHLAAAGEPGRVHPRVGRTRTAHPTRPHRGAHHGSDGTVDHPHALSLEAQEGHAFEGEAVGHLLAVADGADQAGVAEHRGVLGR